VLARGIQENLEKIQEILTMGKPTKLHEVHQLAGRVVALSRFVARLGEKALPFYALMKKLDKKFEWTKEVDAVLAQLKKSVFHTTSVGHTQRKGTVVTIYRHHASGGKHGASGRTK
jgi:hypothetical protein